MNNGLCKKSLRISLLLGLVGALTLPLISSAAPITFYTQTLPGSGSFGGQDEFDGVELGSNTRVIFQGILDIDGNTVTYSDSTISHYSLLNSWITFTLTDGVNTRNYTASNLQLAIVNDYAGSYSQQQGWTGPSDGVGIYTQESIFGSIGASSSYSYLGVNLDPSSFSNTSAENVSSIYLNPGALGFQLYGTFGNFTFHFSGTDPITTIPTSVPDPASTAGLLGMALSGLLAFTRRNRLG